jgi:hypothetical protein
VLHQNPDWKIIHTGEHKSFMKKAVLAGLSLVGIILIVVFVIQSDNASSGEHAHQKSILQQPIGTPQPRADARVPAHFTDIKEVHPLAPTLAPEQFFGTARQAYKVAREIPETLAQLPCYCYCDETIGHKSLHTCYESDHSSHCVTCMEEALVAYRLQKEEKLSITEIRQRIIAQFAPK